MIKNKLFLQLGVRNNLIFFFSISDFRVIKKINLNLFFCYKEKLNEHDNAQVVINYNDIKL